MRFKYAWIVIGNFGQILRRRTIRYAYIRFLSEKSENVDKSPETLFQPYATTFDFATDVMG